MIKDRGYELKYIFATIFAFLLGVFLYVTQIEKTEISNGGSIGGAFTLYDGEGKTVTEDIFSGKPYVIFFGFTHCPDICPTSLLRMANWERVLNDDKKNIRFAFVSVDPERDTPQVLSAYVSHFSDTILPLTGTKENIDAMLKTYGVYAQKVLLDGGGYTMDHHTSVFLFDEDNQFIRFIYDDDDEKTALNKLQALL